MSGKKVGKKLKSFSRRSINREGNIMLSEAYQKGYIAFKVKSFSSENPYSKETDYEKWLKWEDGFYYSLAEENED